MYPGIRWSIGVAAVTLLGVMPQAWAQSTSRLYDKWQIDVSGSVLVMGTDIRVDGEDGNGTQIDGEDVLGLSREKIQPRVSARWRPGRRHELELGYQFARRTGQKTLDRDVTIGDDVWLGAGAILLPGTIVADGAVIGAGSVVIDSIGQYEIWAGNPARKIGERPA